MTQRFQCVTCPSTRDLRGLWEREARARWGEHGARQVQLFKVFKVCFWETFGVRARTSLSLCSGLKKKEDTEGIAVCFVNRLGQLYERE
jgi:hypothetical protein